MLHYKRFKRIRWQFTEAFSLLWVWDMTCLVQVQLLKYSCYCSLLPRFLTGTQTIYQIRSLHGSHCLKLFEGECQFERDNMVLLILCVWSKISLFQLLKIMPLIVLVIARTAVSWIIYYLVGLFGDLNKGERKDNCGDQDSLGIWRFTFRNCLLNWCYLAGFDISFDRFYHCAGGSSRRLTFLLRCLVILCKVFIAFQSLHKINK